DEPGDRLGEGERFAGEAARAGEYEELRERTAEPFDLADDDLHAIAHRRAVLVVLHLALDLSTEQVHLQNGGVERVADLVREPERQRAHGRQRLGVRRAFLERAALGDVRADAEHEATVPFAL